ncbi:MAG: class IV adenylate cyclase [Planctomycetota bacterium]|jgi:predicted adenylyl cyclase CyaB
MRSNLEIKARCREPDRARALATETVGVDRQVDTYFKTNRGRLKLRESSLCGGQLVPYFRPDDDGPRRSNFQLLAVDDPAGLKSMLTEMLGVHRVVSKTREILLHKNVRIHIDEVDGLGSFVELEAVFDGTPEEERRQHELVRWMMAEMGVTDADLIAGSYEGMAGTSDVRRVPTPPDVKPPTSDVQPPKES